MMDIRIKTLVSLILMLTCLAQSRADELVYQDKSGVVRWKSDKSEVALFGANYCLPSACDYRAAGMLGGDRKEMIRNDLTHFSRMGWDGLRLSFWGDWENSDVQGNLIENEHLDLLDYLIAEATSRGIMMLLSPIVTYDANWPDRYGDKDMPGFSAHYRKDELITNPEAVGAQKNYFSQLLNHTNPYTGRKLKDEHNILFIEIINEPPQLVDRPAETVSYINVMCDAIRATGCQKLLYYNISQDFRIAPMVARSKVDGGTYAWYPTQLNIGYTLQGNILPYVADYSAIRDVSIGKRSKLVYEFDVPDVTGSHLYPAMVREFRKGGVQFATQFSYDMLLTASRNLGWQTHNLNMVYTPRKAVSAMIAAKAMKMLPRGVEYGPYPENSTFGNFMVDADRDLSLLNSREVLMYSNDTPEDLAVNAQTLLQIAGCGSSPVVKTDAEGIYFLDKIGQGVWRLEVYPDIATVSDPFLMPGPSKISYEALWNTSSFKVNLPDLGTDYFITSLTEPNGNYPTASVVNPDSGHFTLSNTAGSADRAENSSFSVQPGIYILSARQADLTALPEKVNGVAIHDYVVPGIPESSVIYCLHEPEKEYLAGKIADFTCEIFSPVPPNEVSIYLKINNSGRYIKFPMEKRSKYGYSFRADERLSGKEAIVDYIIGVRQGDMKICYPSKISGILPDDWDFYPQESYRTYITDGTGRLTVWDADTDAGRMRYTRVFRSLPFRHGYVPAGDRKLALEISCKDMLPSAEYTYPLDISASHYISDRIKSRSEAGIYPKAVVVTARRTTPSTEKLLISFNQSDCISWSAAAELTDEFREIAIPVAEFARDEAPMLPQDWPGINPYWYPGSRNNPDSINWGLVENMFFSLRDRLFPGTEEKEKGVQIISVSFEY